MKTKQLQILNFSLLFCLFLTACGQGPDAPVEEQETVTNEVARDPIESIQERYAEINTWLNKAELRMDSFPYECAGDPSGGMVRLFRQQGELVMLKHDYYLGDHFGATETYYLRNERPIFVFVEEGRWNFAGPASEDPMAPNTQDDITERRFYFSDFEAGKTQESLRCLQKDYVIRSWIDIPLNKDEIPNKAVECGPEAQEVLEQFRALAEVETEGFGCE